MRWGMIAALDRLLLSAALGCWLFSSGWAAQPPQVSLEELEGPAPAKAHIAALLKTINRDAVTEELTDRVWFRMQVMQRSFLDVAKLATDSQLVKEIDQCYQAVKHRPATTEELVAFAADFQAYNGPEVFLVHLADQDRQPEIILSGMVTDRATGKPVTGAVVSGRGHRVFSKTDANGRYQISIRTWFPHVGFSVYANASDRVSTSTYVAVPASGKKTINFVLDRERVIQGTVHDPNGRPLANAIFSGLVKRPDADQRNPFVYARTDAKGMFRVARVHPDSQWLPQEIRHAKCAEFDFDDPVPVDSATVQGPFRMTAGCLIAGIVVDESDKPVSSASIQRRKDSPGDYDTTWTDPEGRFSFHDVPEGEWHMVVNHRYLAQGYLKVTADPHRPVTGLKICLTKGQYIAGRVVNPENADGKIIHVGGAFNRARNSSWFTDVLALSRTTVVKKDGTFRFGPVPGDAGQGFEFHASIFSPRHIGKALAKPGETNVVITLEPQGP